MSEYIVKCNEVVGISGKALIVPDYIDTSKEIVRCRDCVHAEPEGEPPRKGYEGLLWCDYLTEGIGFSVLPHNFCAWAERKEGGE